MFLCGWTAVNLDFLKEGANSLVDDVRHGRPGAEETGRVCREQWWDYVIEVAEVAVLVVGVYMSWTTRKAEVEFHEHIFMSIVIFTELSLSAVLQVARHILWDYTDPDVIFLLYFLRCQLTVTVALLLLLGPKFWFHYHPSKTESQPNVEETEKHENPQNQISAFLQREANEDGKVREALLSFEGMEEPVDLNPEEIRAELRRVYTQLQLLKTRSLKQNNPHLPKQKSGRSLAKRFSMKRWHTKTNPSLRLSAVSGSEESCPSTPGIRNSFNVDELSTEQSGEDVATPRRVSPIPSPFIPRGRLIASNC